MEFKDQQEFKELLGQLELMEFKDQQEFRELLEHKELLDQQEALRVQLVHRGQPDQQDQQEAQ
jgi:hypothetical protein